MNFRRGTSTLIDCRQCRTLPLRITSINSRMQASNPSTSRRKCYSNISGMSQIPSSRQLPTLDWSNASFQGKALVLREAARDNRFSDFEAAWDQLEKGVVCTKENGHSVYHLDAGNGTTDISLRGPGASTSALLNYALLSNPRPTEQHQLVRRRRTQLNQPSKRSRVPEPNAEPPQQDSLPNLWPPVPGMLL